MPKKKKLPGKKKEKSDFTIAELEKMLSGREGKKLDESPSNISKENYNRKTGVVLDPESSEKALSKKQVPSRGSKKKKKKKLPGKKK